MGLENPPTTAATGWIALPANRASICWANWRMVTTRFANSGSRRTSPMMLRTDRSSSGPRDRKSVV
jgi:hypothetical protein